MPLAFLRRFASESIRPTCLYLLVACLAPIITVSAYPQNVSQPSPVQGQTAQKEKPAQSPGQGTAQPVQAEDSQPNQSGQVQARLPEQVQPPDPAKPPGQAALAATPEITSVAIFPEAAAQTASQATSQNFVLEIKGTGFQGLKVGDLQIAVLPKEGVIPAKIKPLSLSQDSSMILAQFAAPPSYSLEGVTLYTGSDLLAFSAGSLSCDFNSKVKLSPQVVPKDQVGNKYGNGVAKNFYAIQISIVNECPMAIVVPLAGIRVVVNPGLNTHSPLPSATVGAFYLEPLSSSGGNPPYTWSVRGGSLPDNLSLDKDFGTILGTPSPSVKPGNFSFGVEITDSSVPPLSATSQMVLPVVLPPTVPPDSNGLPDTTLGEDESCTQKGDLVAFSLDHVTSVFSADRKLTGRRAIYFNTVQALATIGSAVEPFLAKSFTQGVAILGGGFTTASKDVFVDMSAEQLQNLTSQSFGSTEQVASHGSLQKFIFVRRSIHSKCKNSLTEAELRHGEFSVLWEASPASAAAPTTQTAPAQASQKGAAPAPSKTGNTPAATPPAAAASPKS